MTINRDAPWVEQVNLFDDRVVLLKNNAVFFGGSATVEFSAGSDCFFMEGAENGLFDVVWNGHVVLDGVEPAQYDVK